MRIKFKDHKWLVFLVIGAMLLRMFPVSQAAEGREGEQKKYSIECKNENVKILIQEAEDSFEETAQAAEGDTVVIAP